MSGQQRQVSVRWTTALCMLAASALLPLGIRGYSPSPDARMQLLAQRLVALEGEIAALQSGGSRVSAPFQVVDASGRTVLMVESVAEGGANLTIGQLSAGGVRLGVGNSGAGFVNIRRPDGVIGASMGQYKGGPIGVQIFNAEGAGGEPVAQLTAGDTDKGEVSVGLTTAGGVTLASGASQAGLIKVRRADGTVGASMGQYKGSAMGLQIFNDQGAGADPIVDLGGDASGGGKLGVADAAGKLILKVSEQAAPADAFVSVGKHSSRYGVTIATASGTRIASIGEAANGGGGVWAFGTDGKMRAVLNGLHGEVHVLDSSGISRATMASAGSGDAAFTIRSSGNTTIARLGEGQLGGWLQLANSGGNAIVEAGIHPKGVGLIRVFPVGSPGGGMVGMPGTFLLGRVGGD